MFVIRRMLCARLSVLCSRTVVRIVMSILILILTLLPILYVLLLLPVFLHTFLRVRVRVVRLLDVVKLLVQLDEIEMQKKVPRSADNDSVCPGSVFATDNPLLNVTLEQDRRCLAQRNNINI